MEYIPVVEFENQDLDLPLSEDDLEKFANETVKWYSGFPIAIDNTTPLAEVNNFADWLLDENPDDNVVRALYEDGRHDITEIPHKYRYGDYSIIYADGCYEDLAKNFISGMGGLNEISFHQFIDEKKLRDLLRDEWRNCGIWDEYEGVDHDDEDEEDAAFNAWADEIIDDPKQVLDEDVLESVFDYEEYGRYMADCDGYNYYNNAWVAIY